MDLDTDSSFEYDYLDDVWSDEEDDGGWTNDDDEDDWARGAAGGPGGGGRAGRRARRGGEVRRGCSLMLSVMEGGCFAPFSSHWNMTHPLLLRMEGGGVLVILRALAVGPYDVCTLEETQQHRYLLDRMVP